MRCSSRIVRVTLTSKTTPMKNLFCFQNAKTTKGLQHGYHTAVLYLAPAKIAGDGINTCEHATHQCKVLCLNTAGKGIFKNIQQSRIKKTRWMNNHPAEFWERVDKEVLNHENNTHRMQTRLKRKFRPCVRINGTSDLWNTDIRTIMYRHPDVQFYDYTKDYLRVLDWMLGKMPRNYHLTYSFGGDADSLAKAKYLLGQGVNVAVVFDAKPKESLPTTWNHFYVVDGDKHDLRFLDKGKVQYGVGCDEPTSEGLVIGLRAKGKARGVIAVQNSFINPNIDS